MKRSISVCIMALAFHSMASAGPLIHVHNQVRNAITDPAVKADLEIQYWTEFYYSCYPGQPCLKILAVNSNDDEFVADLRSFKNINSTRVEIGGISSNKNGNRVVFGSFRDGSCSSKQELNPKVFDKSGVAELTVTARKINEYKYDLHCEINS